MKKTTKCLAIPIGVFLCVSVSAFSTINIAAIQMDVEASIWFSSGQFQLDAINSFDDDGDSSTITIEQGDIRSAGSVPYDYAFEGIVEITPADQVWSGTAQPLQAWFSDSASGSVSTITVSATRVWDVATETDIAALANVTLLTAYMYNPIDGGNWPLFETTTGVDNYQGTTSYVISGGELFNGSVMRMDDFAGYYTFPGSTTVTEYGVDMSTATPNIKLIDSDAIPEPATLLLLGLGGLLVRRKK